jgi:transposase
MKPHDVLHTASALKGPADSVKRAGDEIRVVMERIGRHWFPIAQVLHDAGLFVSAVNPKLVWDFGDNKLRKMLSERCSYIGVKTEKHSVPRPRRIEDFVFGHLPRLLGQAPSPILPAQF